MDIYKKEEIDDKDYLETMACTLTDKDHGEECLELSVDLYDHGYEELYCEYSLSMYVNCSTARISFTLNNGEIDNLEKLIREIRKRIEMRSLLCQIFKKR